VSVKKWKISWPCPLADKDSLWDELNIQKRDLYVKKKNSQEMDGFLKRPWGDRDKELSE
jgi:hypothetical protein